MSLLAAVLKVVEEHGFADTVDLHLCPEAQEGLEVATGPSTQERGVQTTDSFYIGDKDDLVTEVEYGHGPCRDTGLQDGDFDLTSRLLQLQTPRVQDAEEAKVRNLPTIPPFPDFGASGKDDGVVVANREDPPGNKRPATLPRPPEGSEPRAFQRGPRLPGSTWRYG